MMPFESEKDDQFMRLYVENETALRGFVRSLVPTLEDVGDVVQETAAVLWRKFEDLDSAAGKPNVTIQDVRERWIAEKVPIRHQQLAALQRTGGES